MIARTITRRRARRPHGNSVSDRVGNYLSVRPLQLGSPCAPTVMIGHPFGRMIAETARRRLRDRRDRDRRREDQWRAAAAPVVTAIHATSVQEPGEQAPGGLAHRGAAPGTASATRSASRSPTSCTAVAHSGAGKPLFEAAAANVSPHAPAKVDTDNAYRGPLLLIIGREGQHGARGDHYAHTQAVPALHRRYRPDGVPRPRTLLHRRPRLADGR
jgi:hypothetical protein